MVLQKLFI